MNADFELELAEKVNALPLSDDDKKRAIDIAFWAMEQVAEPKPEAAKRAEGKPYLTRNMNGDLLLIDGEKSSVVATSFSALWNAIIDFASTTKG